MEGTVPFVTQGCSSTRSLLQEETCDGGKTEETAFLLPGTSLRVSINGGGTPLNTSLPGTML
jgi:hypothetical protein